MNNLAVPKPMKKTLITLCSLVLAFASAHLKAAPLGTAFTYQGRLNDGANPANGRYDLQFIAYDALSAGNQIGNLVTNLAVTVSNGLFTVNLDFGANVFTGNARWLSIGVRSNGVVASFTLLNPLQPLTPAPNAIYASTAGTVTSGAIHAGQLGTSNAPAMGQTLSYNGTSLFWQTPGGSSLWSLNGNNDAYFNGGNIGIGTLSPSTYGHGGTAKILEVNNSGTDLHSQAHLMLSSGVDSLLDSSIGTVTWAQPGGMAAFIAAHSRSTTPNAPAARLILGTRNVGDPAALERMVIQEDGNIALNPPASLFFGNYTRQMLNLWDTSFAIGVQDNALYNRSGGRFHWFQGGHHENSPDGNAGGGMTLMSLDQQGVHFGTRLGQFLRLYEDGVNYYGSGVQGGTHYFRTGRQSGDAFAWHKGGTHVDNARDPGPGGRTLMTLDEERGLFVRGAVNASAGIVIGNNPGTIDAPIYSDNAASSRVVLWNIATASLMDLHCRQGDVSTLTIRGGADIAEPFAMSHGGIEPGSVVIIDEDNPGKLKTSSHAYDKRVAGIVSGANGIRPGISLIQEGKLEAGENVALTGRVYVKADASFAAIKPGDLLTTSDTPGHAMMVTDPARAQGAILGKAMSALKEGKGMVLVLVSLQ
jgi:hypothetical protein